MKSLVLAEKPSVARDIARVLDCHKNMPGAIEGSKYIVTWALGHLVTLADPEEYDKKFKEWNMSYLPMLPERWELVVIKQTSKQYHNVKTQLFRKDVSDIIIATDAGREGELVARWILDKSGCHKPIKRLWISSVTDKAIREGFLSLKDGRQYNNLYYAAKSRAEADWLVGINATRALTCKYNAQLSCGRVQTPTLAIIARREEEIRSFKPEEYYGLSCVAGNVKWSWQNEKNGSLRSFKRSFITDLESSLKGQALQITDVQKSARKTFSPGLYDLTELQRDANRRFGFSAKETLNIMQRLYEQHKVLTYPRTDSRYIGSDIVPTIKERLKACNIGPYKKFIPSLLKAPIKTSKAFVDDAKVSDHHAIIPTEEFVQLEHMSNDERKIYDLVIRRFISILYPAFEYEQTTLKASAAGQAFTAKGKIILSPGWKAIYDSSSAADSSFLDAPEEDDASWQSCEQPLPLLKKGEQLSISQIALTTGKTKPPARFTEATLLAALVRVADFVADPRIKKLLKEKDKDKKDEHGGIGTPATRAAIIETLKTRDYITVEKGKFIPTAAGLALIDALPDSVTQPDMTAVWAEKQAAVETGEMTIERFIDGLYAEVSRLVESADIAISATEKQPVKTALNRLAVKCPSCGSELVMTPKTCACTGCQFKIWLEVRGKKLTEKQAEKLIGKGKTDVIKGFKSKKNDDTYSMIVTLKNAQTGELGFEYPPRDPLKGLNVSMPKELKL